MDADFPQCAPLGGLIRRRSNLTDTEAANAVAQPPIYDISTLRPSSGGSCPRSSE